MPEMKSLRQSILIPLLIIIGSSFLFLAVIMFQFYAYSFEASSAEKMSKMVERVNHIMGKYGQSPASLNQLVLESMAAIKDISAVEIAFFDAGGKPVFQEELIATNTFFVPSFINKLPHSPHDMIPHRIYQVRLDGRIYFYYAAPLDIAGVADVQYICLSRYMSVYSFLTERLLAVSLLYIFVFIGVAIILVRFFTQKIITPLKLLGDYATSIINQEPNDYTPCRNIAEINLLGRCIQDMVASIENSKAKQRTFFENISHELRTPVMAVQGYAAGLADGIFDDEKKAIEVIHREGDRLGKLIEQIMLLSSIDNNVYQQDKQCLNLKDFLYEINDNLAAVLAQRGKEMQITGGSEVCLYADKEILLQALHNPIINAIRFARQDIAVQIIPAPNSVKIEISDDGPGFRDDILPHVFDRFYKGPAGRAGLGMAIAKAAVELLNGTIEVYNRDGAVVIIEIFHTDC